MQQRKVCCIFACPNHKSKNQLPGMRLYQLPQNDHYGSHWRKWIADQNFPLVYDRKHIHLCNLHFKAECILPTKRLAVGSLPTVPALTIQQMNLDSSTSPEDDLSLSKLLKSASPVLKCNSSAVHENDLISTILPSIASNTDQHEDNVGSILTFPTEETGSSPNASSVSQSSGISVVNLQQMYMDPPNSPKDHFSSANLLRSSPVSCVSHENDLTSTTPSSIACSTVLYEENLSTTFPKEETAFSPDPSSVSQSSGNLEMNIQQMYLDPPTSPKDNFSFANLLTSSSPVSKYDSCVSHENDLTSTTPSTVASNSHQYEENLCRTYPTEETASNPDPSSVSQSSGNLEISQRDFSVTPPSEKYINTEKLERYITELSPSDFRTPKSARMHLGVIRRHFLKVNSNLKNERQKKYRLQQKVKSLEEFIKHLKDEKK